MMPMTNGLKCCHYIRSTKNLSLWKVVMEDLDSWVICSPAVLAASHDSCFQLMTNRSNAHFFGCKWPFVIHVISIISTAKLMMTFATEILLKYNILDLSRF